MKHDVELQNATQIWAKVNRDQVHICAELST